MVYDYLSAVLSDVLHCQREPLPLCLALMQYDKELVSSEHSASPHPSIIHFHQYYSKWLPQQCREELVSFWQRQEIVYVKTCNLFLLTITVFIFTVQGISVPFQRLSIPHFIHCNDESCI